ITVNDVKVKGDAIKTREALRNIVDNAIKFTPAAKKVSVATEELADAVFVKGADEGGGIDPKGEDEIFEKNRVWSGRVKNSGAGLGLYLSKQFIELCGGIITFKVEPGVSTTFIIKLLKTDGTISK